MLGLLGAVADGRRREADEADEPGDPARSRSAIDDGLRPGQKAALLLVQKRRSSVIALSCCSAVIIASSSPFGSWATIVRPRSRTSGSTNTTCRAHRPVLFVGPLLSPLAGRPAHVQPVRRPVAGATPWRRNERLDCDQLLAEAHLPIRTEPPHRACKGAARQVRDRDAGKDEEPAPGDDTMAMAPQLAVQPSHPSRTATWRASVPYTIAPRMTLTLPLAVDPIADRGAKGTTKAERVMLGHRRFEQGLLFRRDRIHRHWLKRGEGGGNGRLLESLGLPCRGVGARYVGLFCRYASRSRQACTRRRLFGTHNSRFSQTVRESSRRLRAAKCAARWRMTSRAIQIRFTKLTPFGLEWRLPWCRRRLKPRRYGTCRPPRVNLSTLIHYGFLVHQEPEPPAHGGSLIAARSNA